MSVTIPDDVLHAARMSDAELKQEIAILLFQREKLTLAQAAGFAGADRLQFQHILAARRIAVHYDATDLQEDVNTLRQMGRS